jgi:hypothetical protein
MEPAGLSEEQFHSRETCADVWLCPSYAMLREVQPHPTWLVCRSGHVESVGICHMQTLRFIFQARGGQVASFPEASERAFIRAVEALNRSEWNCSQGSLETRTKANP